MRTLPNQSDILSLRHDTSSAEYKAPSRTCKLGLPTRQYLSPCQSRSWKQPQVRPSLWHGLTQGTAGLVAPVPYSKCNIRTTKFVQTSAAGFLFRYLDSHMACTLANASGQCHDFWSRYPMPLTRRTLNSASKDMRLPCGENPKLLGRPKFQAPFLMAMSAVEPRYRVSLVAVQRLPSSWSVAHWSLRSYAS
jgi:hypothetical protein